jgi:alkanesulfonate monooxygenase SsuD/methylene tetrahydromethanopterin reductase-like flavin-dependent oxidoreductase (luciferase family)
MHDDRRSMIGIGFTPFETRTEVIMRLAVRAESRGLESVAVAEGWGLDSTIVLAELASQTHTIGLSTGIVSVWTRTPATLAMMAAGLQRASDGRFTLGLGAGSPPLTEGFHGLAWERPMERVQRTLVDVRALLNGERLPHPANDARPLKLAALPETPVPIALAALSPASIRFAGEYADAWTPFLWARSNVQHGREMLGEASTTRVEVGVPAALGPHAEQIAAWWLETYRTRMGPIYPRLINGFEPEDLTLLGAFDEAADAIGAWFEAGADHVQIVLPPGRPEDELAAMIDAAATVRSSSSRT